jgi:hypothetical protein
MKGIILCKHSICTLSYSWVVIEFVVFLFNKFPIMKKTFVGSGDDIPCTLNNNDKIQFLHLS